MKSILSSVVLLLLLLALSSVVQGKESVAALRQQRALGSGSHFGGDYGKDHPERYPAVTQETPAAEETTVEAAEEAPVRLSSHDVDGQDPTSKIRLCM